MICGNEQCKSSKVKSEGLMEGRTRLTCQACGWTTVQDAQGRGLLTDDMPGNPRKPLTEG